MDTRRQTAATALPLVAERFAPVTAEFAETGYRERQENGDMKTNKVITSAAIAFMALGCGGAEGDLDSEPVAEVEESLVTTCSDFSMPSVPIDFRRELVIRELSVVEDSCRTSWSAVCSTATRGRWTFGWLMTAMSGATDVTSPVAKQFVANWLKNWLNTQTVPAPAPGVQPRPMIDKSLIKPWLQASGCSVNATLDTCSLDLMKAPFRLLAVVNRIDMSGGSPYGGPQSPGEFRLVFGALGTDVVNGITNTTLQATAILEYNFPSTKSSFQWATLLHDLSGVSFGATYNQKLQAITDLIVGPVAQPGKPNNGSVISQIRTNEISFDLNMSDVGDPSLAQWEMRQFKLPCASGSCQLAQTTVSQTPDTAMNNTPELMTFIITNRSSLLSVQHVLPTTLLGGSSKSPGGVAAVIWENPNPLTSSTAGEMTAGERASARHHFGFSTCNGCHYAETGNQNGLFHIGPRDPGTLASISNFLTAGGASDPLATTDNVNPTNRAKVTDPTSPARAFFYNEPWRRACEIRRILNGFSMQYTTSTGHQDPNFFFL